MKLYSYFRSSAAFRVRIALNIKSLDHDMSFVDLKSGMQWGEYGEINAQNLVPTLEDGSLIIGQSIAIIEYLDEAYPSPPLLPEAIGDRAIVRQMAQIVACDIHPLNNLRILRYLKRTIGAPQAAINEWYAHWIAEGLSALESLVRRYGSGSNCFGDAVTMADVALVPQIWNARSMDVELGGFPQLVAISDCLMSRLEFRLAAPEAQPDIA